MDKDAIVINNLTKLYQGSKKPALMGVNLKIRRNSIFGLLGPNGAGKSTLINILAGLTTKTEGKVSILGVDLDTKFNNTKYLLGIVPQEIYLDTFFSVKDLLEITAGYFGLRTKERKTQQILQDMRLSEKSEATARMLSGGMKRRLLIAKAMVHSPPILILDEPTAGVDVDLRSQLWDYILDLKSRGTTIILTTHYLAEAEKLCDDIAFIDKGRLIHADQKQHLMKTLGSKKMIIEFENNSVDLTHPKVQKFNIQDNILSINFDADQDINNLLKQVIDLGFKIRDIKIQSDDLEAIYKKILPS